MNSTTYYVESLRVYIYYIEPFLLLYYGWILWRIARSNVQDLQSPFFKFFVYCGIASCSNILVVTLKRFENTMFNGLDAKDLILNLIVFGSHTLSLSHTIGKILVIASRFTAIYYPLRNFWTSFRIKFAALLMFLIPAFIYSFLVPLKPSYRENLSGACIYIGVDDWAQKLSKLISATSYLIFIFVSFPLCAASIYQLRKAQLSNQNMFVKHERVLMYNTIAIALAHLVKSAQQIFWFATMIIENGNRLFDIATSLYNIANALTTFVPPMLLLTTSKLVRHEVIFWCVSRRFRYNSAIAQSSTFSSTQQNMNQT